MSTIAGSKKAVMCHAQKIFGFKAKTAKYEYTCFMGTI